MESALVIKFDDFQFPKGIAPQLILTHFFRDQELGQLNDLLWSPDGKHILTNSNSQAGEYGPQVWDSFTGARLADLTCIVTSDGKSDTIIESLFSEGRDRYLKEFTYLFLKKIAQSWTGIDIRTRDPRGEIHEVSPNKRMCAFPVDIKTILVQTLEPGIPNRKLIVPGNYDQGVLSLPSQRDVGETRWTIALSFSYDSRVLGAKFNYYNGLGYRDIGTQFCFWQTQDWKLMANFYTTTGSIKYPECTYGFAFSPVDNRLAVIFPGTWEVHIWQVTL